MSIRRKIFNNIRHRFKGTDFVKEMVMTILATTISITLTFGTAQLIENLKNQSDGRKAVMMVLHEMDSYVNGFHELAKQEDKNSKIALYVMNNIENLDSLPHDTLMTALGYLIQTENIKYDDSNEKIFQNSPDIWKNIENTTVVDRLQDFFRERSSVIDYINTNFQFAKPITQAEEYEILQNSTDYYFDQQLIIDVLRRVMKDNKTQQYLQYAPSRREFYHEYANEWQRVSDKCKFMMSITDEDMEAYAEETSRTGKPLTKSKLVGKWKITSTDDSDKQTFEFRADNTFTHYRYVVQTSALYSGDLLATATMSGRWEIKGDSLIREYTQATHFEMDSKGISYTPDMKDTVASYVKEMQQYIDKKNKEAKAHHEVTRKANMAYIDKSGNKIEMQATDINEDGKEEDATYYIVREK